MNVYLSKVTSAQNWNAVEVLQLQPLVLPTWKYKNVTKVKGCKTSYPIWIISYLFLLLTLKVAGWREVAWALGSLPSGVRLCRKGSDKRDKQFNQSIAKKNLKHINPPLFVISHPGHGLTIWVPYKACVTDLLTSRESLIFFLGGCGDRPCWSFKSRLTTGVSLKEQEDKL